MPPNEAGHAPEGGILDNPSAPPAFAVDIGRARFFFTPGVPRELRRMLEEQIIPRRLARSCGTQETIFLKRFHTYGIGESHADRILTGVEAIDADGAVKLGFRAHYPQLETKLTVRGRTPTTCAAGCTGRGGGAQALRQLHPGRGRSDARARGARRAGA
ncbi:MAG: hypothetical protein LC121_25170 [Anaerolineae bacterium]|nr:hypothetical protein [Anaerolineae bacterium]